MNGLEMLGLLKEFISLGELQNEIGRRVKALDLLYKEKQISDEQYLKALLTAKKDTEKGMAQLIALKEKIASL